MDYTYLRHGALLHTFQLSLVKQRILPSNGPRIQVTRRREIELKRFNQTSICITRSMKSVADISASGAASRSGLRSEIPYSSALRTKTVDNLVCFAAARS